MKSKKELKTNKSSYDNLKKLMENKKFLDKLFNTHSNYGIKKIFDSYGVDITRFKFEDFCNLLLNSFDEKGIDVSVNSLDAPVSVDYENKNPKIVVNVKD